MAIISAHRLCKSYQRGSETILALDNASFEVKEGEFIAVVGPSGSGKSTLLNLLGCMDVPTSGTLEIFGEKIELAGDRLRTELRRKFIGFVFQNFGLASALTVEENIKLPGLFAKNQPHARVEDLLERVGLRHRSKHRPHELSGGEMQRTAIARALYNQPKLLLADEPTGNLDSGTAESILRLLEELNRDGLAVVAVTHNEVLARRAGRVLALKDGKLARP